MMPQLIDITDTEEIKKWLVPSTQVRRQWKTIVARVKETGRSVVVTKGGKPDVEISPVEKKQVKKTKAKLPQKESKDWLSKYVGSWKGTYLDDDKFWEGILTKDSKPVEETMI